MLTKLSGGTIYDPVHGVSGQVRDLYVRDGRLIDDPGPNARIDRLFNLRGKTVMAGAIDLHTHIGGGKVNIARAILPEDQRRYPVARGAYTRSGAGLAAPSTFLTGYRYAELGYTACFEPAVVASNARHAHLELGDIPMVDKGGYLMLGNDDFLLSRIAERADPHRIRDYIAFMLRATQCLAVKVVNPGGISAFKFNQRALDLDETHGYYPLTPRMVVSTLVRALHELGVPHPLHVHASNLGVPGNVATTLATIEAAEGLPIHLTHVQFHAYGTEGERRFSSAAEDIANAVNRCPNVSVDVGQIMFGQTVTCSADTMRQYANRRHAHPNKSVCMDIECDGGCGIVPFRYNDRNFVNALQWAIGLELFLRVQNPWQIFLTTDHPNGAPFTSYPHLIRLLMDRRFRREQLDRIHPGAKAASQLAALEREYTLDEIAIMTRAAPARILGLTDRGHLGPGAVADITVYEPDEDRERMFGRPLYVFKDGELIVRDGRVVHVVWGATHVVRAEYDTGIERDLGSYFERHRTQRLANFVMSDDEIVGDGRGRLIVHRTERRS